MLFLFLLLLFFPDRIGHENFELINHDIIVPLMVEVDQIYHLASPASPIKYMYNPIKTIKTNTIGGWGWGRDRACDRCCLVKGQVGWIVPGGCLVKGQQAGIVLYILASPASIKYMYNPINHQD